MPSKLFLATWALVLALALGCAITDYPIITDDRGDYSGVIRTAHKAYIVPSFTVATVWPDGTDQLYWMVYQNAYGDQKLFTHNNYDPTGAVTFLDQTYCDWNFEDCEVARAWNPIQNDDEWDYEFFEDCSGARSLISTWSLSFLPRIGECGDRLPFRGNLQEVAEAFSNLETTTWRGERAYHVGLDAANFALTLTSSSGEVTRAPVFGRYSMLLTDEFQLAVPMTPNARHQLAWFSSWVAEHGRDATLRYEYRGIVSEFPMRFRSEGLAYNAGRF